MHTIRHAVITAVAIGRRRLDTRMGTMYLMVPKLRNQGYIPFFVTERKRSEAALIQVVQEAFVQGVSTRKMEKLARSLGIENLSRSQVSEMTKGLNEQVQYFRSRPLDELLSCHLDRCTV
jgi:putative transposase